MSRPTPTEHRYAVCIGINTYQTSAGLGSLRYAEADAQAMDALLGQLGFEDDCRCLLLGSDATLQAINEALGTMILDQPGEHDLVIFYFAGHSLPLVINESDVQQGAARKSEVFLTTYDFDRQKIKQFPSFRMQQALGMERLRTTFFAGEAGSRRRLFLFDSCYSGDFFGATYRDDEANPVQNYLKQVLTTDTYGRVALSSCLPVQRALEDPTLGHGRFTYYVLEALSGRAVEAFNREGRLTVNGLFEYLTRKLPAEQRPVLSGVQQDTFELIFYPHLAQTSRQVDEETLADRRNTEKSERLRAMMADHTSFMRDRLESFVGREAELMKIRQRMQENRSSGGYVTITGMAGQGKSSVIAQLVQEAITEQGSQECVAFHFIPFNPGPDHQVGLLRDLIARLMFKHDLSDLYLDYVAYGNRPALRDFFPRVLQEIVDKGEQEIIFIDGLDQIDEDANGHRDLTFLPTEPPPGIVFVLGTRPNETLRPLTLRKPHVQYELPNLSRSDFDRILHHRSVSLSTDITDQFYHAMQENALFLDLVAKELTDAQAAIAPEEMIKRLANNPANLFGFALERLQRTQEWEIIEQVLGLLLASREPLSILQLKQIITVKEYRLRSAIRRLGGLLTESVPKENTEYRRYSLFHLMFQDYLGQREHEVEGEYLFATSEVEQYHHRLAQWCEGEIWQDTIEQGEQLRRVYARQHYITHLYLAKQWLQMFSILDDSAYGKAKVQHDPSMRSYVLDLIWGERAATWENVSLEQGIDNLAVLWRYSLLRCSISSQADRYPDETFETMLMLGQSVKALGIAELLTNPVRKVRVLLLMARLLATQSHRQQEAAQLVMQATMVTSLIEHTSSKDDALSALANNLAETQQWHEAERVIATIKDSDTQARALITLADSLDQIGEREAAARLWQEVERVIATIKDSYPDESKQARVLSTLASSLLQAHQWQEAERVIIRIPGIYTHEKIEALTALARGLTEAQQGLEVQRIEKEIQNQFKIVDDSWSNDTTEFAGTSEGHQEEEQLRYHNEGLQAFAGDLMQAQRWQDAERVIADMSEHHGRADALRALASHLAQAQLWQEAERVIATIKNSDTQAKALSVLASRLAQAQQQQAARILHKAECVIVGIQSGWGERALEKLARSLLKVQQWQEAERVIIAIPESSLTFPPKKLQQLEAFGELASGLVQAQQWQEAERVITTILDSHRQKEALSELASGLVQAQQWQEARRVIATIPDSQRQARALSDLASHLAKVGDHETAQLLWQEAQRVIATIPDSQSQGWALRKLAYSLAQAQQWQEAQRVIATIVHSDRQLEAFGDLASSLAQAQQWQEARRVIATIPDSQSQARALRDLASTLASSLAQSQQWQEAERIIATIQSEDYKADALRALASSLVQAQQWQEAERVIATISDSHRQEKALSELASSLVQAQQWQEARRVIATISDSQRQAEALSDLASHLAKVGDHETAQLLWQEAQRVIATIQREDSRAEAFSALASHLAKVGDHETAQLLWQEARHIIITTIQVSGIQDWELLKLTRSLAQAQQWPEAQRVIATIQSEDSRAEAFSALASSLAQAQQWKTLLGKIQNAWKSARTSHEALSLLPLAFDFFSMAPSLGKKLYEGFVWVDTFFRT